MVTLLPVSTMGSQLWHRVTGVASLQNESPEVAFLSVPLTCSLSTPISCPSLSLFAQKRWQDSHPSWLWIEGHL